MGHILRANVMGNYNIGLFAFVNDNFCLVGNEVPKKLIKEMEKVLKVPVYRTSIAGTSLIGVFVSGNNNKLLVPDIIFHDELHRLREISDVDVIKTKYTALGNNILCNDSGCLVNPEYENSTINNIKKSLSIPVKRARINEEIEVIGSCLAITNKYGYGHPEMKDFEKEFFEETLKIRITKGTVAMGNPFVRSSLVVNKYGFVAGSQSTGIELSQIDEAFGFIE
jgi:translation initiation factor 6